MSEMTAKITASSGNGWWYGEIGKYKFCAKVYGEGSVFGINNGRVSKLQIVDEEKRKAGAGWTASIVNYDRGWDIEPSTDEERDILRRVLERLEALPRPEPVEAPAAKAPDLPKPPVDEIRIVLQWMKEQMYGPVTTEWTYGNEHDRMSEAADLLETLLGREEE